MQTYTFHVIGMHCQSCVILTEKTIQELPEVKGAKSSLHNHTVKVIGNFGEKTPEQIARDLSEILKPHGYTLTIERQKHNAHLSDFWIAMPIAAGFIGLFFFLQKLGVVNLITSSDVSYGTSFLIGVIASVSTCMAIVGGLALSISANFAKQGDKIRPQLLFHVGRLIAFFILGGAIGALGALFQFGRTSTFALNVAVAAILFILGINLLDVFPWIKKLQPTIPSFIGQHVHGLKNINHTCTPFLVGVTTFFLPCGFTQSMQIYTMTTGNFWDGAMIMFIFALGTLPLLAFLSFSSLGMRTKTRSSVFFKSAGLVVLFFGFFNLVNSFVAYGIIPPVLNF